MGVTEPANYSRRVDILLVEDDPDDVERITRELERYDIRAVRADGFHAGVRLLEAGDFDAVVVEHELGSHTGLEFLDHARRVRREMAVVIVTDLDSRAIDDAALTAGAAGFVPKLDGWEQTLCRTLRYAARSQRTPESHDGPKASGKDLTLQVALARGMTVRDAAQAAGMSERTAYRRMSDVVFRAQLSQLRSELRERMIDRTIDAMTAR